MAENLRSEQPIQHLVQSAEERYRHARAEADAALESCGCNATGAEIESLSEAQGRESAALDEYMSVLRTFHDCMVSRKTTLALEI